jgi:hypothetical protein
MLRTPSARWLAPLALLPLALLAVTTLRAQPKTGEAPEYTGSAVCASCHTRQAAGHRMTGHARSLSRAAAHPLADRFLAAPPPRRAPGYRFAFRVEDGLRVRAADGRDVMDIPVEWAFGAGHQAVTFVTRVSPEWYLEHAFSYYPPIAAWALTPGQGELRPQRIQDAMGFLYKTLDEAAGIRGCFECHSTGPVQVLEGDELAPLETGVQCEACHGPGRAHVAAAAQTGREAAARRTIGNPGRLAAREQLRFCGACHRPPAVPETRIDWDYAWNVRHQPVYLAESRCFTESGGRLTCLTCHPSHQPMDDGTAGTRSNTVCRSCHRAEANPPASACGAVGSANCVDCHMPLVSPQSPLRFANHWIGVYGDGAKLKPRR